MTKQIELANGKGFALVDDKDYERLSRYKWFLGSRGYATRSGKGRHGGTILMHREILGLNPGDKRQGDHVSGNRLDNRRQNLRVCTLKENCYNKQKTKGLSSKYKGVRWSGQQKRWQVQVEKNGIRQYLGFFDDETEAGIAYDWEARKLFGEFAAPNFPDIHRPPQGQTQLKPKGSSKYFGVFWNTKNQKWIASIFYQGKTNYIGSFENEEDAARAFDKAARKYRGENTRTNFH